MIVLPNNIFFDEVERLISAGESVVLIVRGVSMTPLLRDSVDGVRLSPAGGRKLNRGDIVLFRYNGEHRLHRIVSCRGDILTLQGDGVLHAVETVPASDVVAIVDNIIRPGGKMVRTNSFRQNLYWRLWLMLRPVRRCILGLHRRII